MKVFNNSITALRERTAYPFITEDGEPTILTDAVTSIVLYITPDTPLPVYVEAYSYEDTIGLRLYDYEDNLIGTAVYSSGYSYIYSTYGILTGIISWYALGVDTLIGAIKGGYPVPNTRVLVLPELCIPVSIPRPAVLYIDDSPVSPSISYIVYKDGAAYANDTTISVSSPYPDVSGVPLRQIDWVGYTPWGSISMTTGSIDGELWIKPEATCDLRVITQDSLHIKSTVEN